MADATEQLRRLVRDEVAKAQPFTIMTVSAVRDDDTVNLDYGTQVITGIPCSRSYTHRSVGDVVMVLRTRHGWRVLGPVGAEYPAPALRYSDLIGAPAEVDVTWGVGQPSGSGWKQATSVWVRDNEVYAQLAAEAPPPAPKRSPDPDTVVPNADAAYRFGSLARDQDNPIQGAWYTSAYPAYSGAWFYGTKIKNACDRGTVDFIEMRVVRSKARSGSYGNVPTRLFLHSAQDRTSRPPNLFNPHTGPGLQLGEAATFRLPDDWVNALASGSARGIGCSAPKGGDYLVYGSCGQLTIHFK